MAQTDGALPAGVVAGNAPTEGQERGGWFLGHFWPAGDARQTEAVEVKWGVHPAGEARAAWAVNAHATSLSVLVSGRFRLWLPGATVLLAAPGDYLLWPSGVPHHWAAEVDSIVLSVRWPSRPADSQPLAEGAAPRYPPPDADGE